MRLGVSERLWQALARLGAEEQRAWWTNVPADLPDGTVISSMAERLDEEPRYEEPPSPCPLCGFPMVRDGGIGGGWRGLPARREYRCIEETCWSRWYLKRGEGWRRIENEGRVDLKA